MDPYIEACGLWEEFHRHLIEKICEHLKDNVAERYLVRGGERTYLVLVESEGKRTYPFFPDAGVSALSGRKKASKKGGTAVAEAPGDVEPISLRAFIAEEHRERFVEIYEAGPEQRLVTSIEVLSPTNKRPNTPGWDLYQRKRQSILLGDANLVEIDLLRGGQRMPMLDPWPTSPYTLLVAKAKKDQLCQVWPATFQRPLPPIPVPLLKPDQPISLSLQSLIEGIYQRYRYDYSIDYTRSLTPPLAAEEATWFAQQLRERASQP
jgi:hypothetical protein